jgi:hypothetical protein
VTVGFQVPGDLALSADGRYVQLSQGADDIASRVNIGLQTFAGTWIYDQNKGVKYLQGIFEKPTDAGLALLRAEVYRVISETAGVDGVDRITIDFDSPSRTASLKWWAHTADGIPVVSEVTIK